MASSSIRFHRTIRALSGLHRLFPVTSASPCPVLIHGAVSSKPPFSQPPNLIVQSRLFRSSSISLLSARSSVTNDLDEIGPDSILFEGCDYNHWLIVMDIPEDECSPDDPDPQRMIWTYEQTCAKGLNISVEEAKKKIYACSTTIYTGFQVVMTEEESKKFEGLPGVIFVLPDSYIDPINKEYGGDKYINGTVIPRPPPVQYGRPQGRRVRNRNPGQYNRGSMQGDGRNYGASQNYPPQQNYGQESQNYGQAPQNHPPQQNYPQNHPPQLNYGQAPQNHPPQQNYAQAPQNYPSQQNYGQAPQNYPPQQNYGQAPQNYPPQQGYGQASQNYPPQQGYSQASQNYPQQQTYGSASQQGSGPASPQYAPQQSFGSPGQGGRRDSVPKPRETEWGYTFKPSSTYAKDGIPSYIEDFKPSYMQEFEQAAKGDYFARQTGNAGSAQNESSSWSEDDQSGEQGDAQGEGRK